MITTLYFSERTVREQLFERVERASRPLLIAAVRHGRSMRPPADREPFTSLDRDFGDALDQVLVADEGSVEGMWRDPVGDLADALYPDDRAGAYAATSGYLLLHHRRVLGVVKRHGSPTRDRYFLQEQLAKTVPGVPPPDPSTHPRRTKPTGSIHDETTAPRARMPAPMNADPWQLLGIGRDASRDEARKAFRTLIAQYHPDKVAHLAPEFRELADRRTREILAAWDQLERELGGR